MRRDRNVPYVICAHEKETAERARSFRVNTRISCRDRESIFSVVRCEASKNYATVSLGTPVSSQDQMNEAVGVRFSRTRICNRNGFLNANLFCYTTLW